MDQKMTLSEEEFRALIGVSRTTLWRLRKAGKVPFYRIGSKIRFAPHHAEVFLASCERTAYVKTRKRTA
jgi:excisionase family DNA binding protein